MSKNEANMTDINKEQVMQQCKILKIDEEGKAYFCSNLEKPEYKPITEIGKDDLLNFADYISKRDDFLKKNYNYMDPYINQNGSKLIKNDAEYIIYKNVYEALNTLIKSLPSINDEINKKILKDLNIDLKSTD